MNYNDTLDELNTTLGDSEDTTFTPEEKARALKKAWNDSYVVKTVWDSTLVWASNTFSYNVPTSMDAVSDIYIAPYSDTSTAPVTSDLYEVVNGVIRFREAANNIFNVGNTIYVKGRKKLDWNSDTLDTETLQEYVIATAGVNTLTLLGYKKANLFLKNDLTMAELVTLRRELDTERKELRAKLSVTVERA